MGFARFMATGIGRGIRIVAGAVVITIGLLRVRGGRGALLALLGLVPLLAGTFDVCVLAPLLRVPFKGSDVRVPADSADGMPLDTSVR
ncbi:MAG: DUF2892 domain-containing protein [Thermomicrobia bacterium]|nr:DUF2892 domain-containing protein [Thermomicrobia bacterium]